MKIKFRLVFGVLLILSSVCYSQESYDLTAVEKIKQEGLKNSQIENIVFELTDKSGPRLTNSKGFERAAGYAVEQLKDWGLTNAQLEPWGDFGPGWEVNKSYLAMTKPYYMPFIAVPKAWSESTDGQISGKVIFLNIEKEEDLEKYEGSVKGAIVAVKMNQSSQNPTFEADAHRYTEEELNKMKQPDASPMFTPEQFAEMRARRALFSKVNTFCAKEGAMLLISGTSGMHGTLFTSSSRDYIKDSVPHIPVLETAPEFVNLMKRLTEKNVDVEIEAEVKTTFDESDPKAYNVIAEIPGSDKNLKSEIVMLGAHLDSWHGATGATDNGAGCAVMMEAVRILQATGLQPKRTIRIALWSGEEQGILGSRNYVKNHLGDSETREFKKEQEKVSAYYNIDNGTGRIRGIYLQGNEAVRPIFTKWFEPFDSLISNTTLTINNTGGTDHLPFNWVDIPGFQFIQDPIEYWTRTHHSNMDTYERLVIDDLKQMAVIVASFVYNTAQRDEKLPRIPFKVETTRANN